MPRAGHAQHVEWREQHARFVAIDLGNQQYCDRCIAIRLGFQNVIAVDTLGNALDIALRRFHRLVDHHLPRDWRGKRRDRLAIPCVLPCAHGLYGGERIAIHASHHSDGLVINQATATASAGGDREAEDDQKWDSVWPSILLFQRVAGVDQLLPGISLRSAPTRHFYSVARNGRVDRGAPGIDTAGDIAGAEAMLGEKASRAG